MNPPANSPDGSVHQRASVGSSAPAPKPVAAPASASYAQSPLAGAGDSEGDNRSTLVIQAAAAAAPEVSLDDVRRRIRVGVGIVRRHWWLGVIAAILAGGAAGFVLQNRTNEYVAVTTLLAQNPRDRILGTSESASNSPGDPGTESALQNYTSLLASRVFFERLASSFSPEDGLAIQQPYLTADQTPSPARLAAVLSGQSSADRQRGRDFFVLSARHVDRALSLSIAGHFSAEFQRLVQEQAREAREDATKILRGQADALSDEIKRLSDERREYRKENKLITIEENQGMLTERLRRINQAIAEVRVQRVRLETQLRQAEDDLSRSRMPFDNPVLSTFGNIQPLRIQLDGLFNERSVLTGQLGPNHPKMQEADRNIAAVEKTIADSFRIAFEDLRSQLALARASEEEMSNELTRLFNLSLELDRLSGGFKRLSDELLAKENSLGVLLEKIEETERKATTPVEAIQVIDPPFISRQTALREFMLIAAVAGIALCAFVGAPLGAHVWSERISGNMDLEAILGKEVIGVLPRFSRVSPSDRPHMVRDNVKLDHVETFLSSAAQFDLLSKQPYPKLVLVTSTVPGEGKSTFASNLAATHTRYGRKALLLDCDFRRPVQHNNHQIQHDNGLLAWASRGFPWSEDLLVPGGALGLSLLPDGTALIPAGGVDLQPGHVLVARPMAELFRRLVEAFDVVVVDSPPAGIFQDAYILARYCSETIVIVREGRPHLSQLKKVLFDLQKTRAPALGLVLNGSSLRNLHPSVGARYGYGKYGYNKYGSGYSGRYRDAGKSSPPKTHVKVAVTPVLRDAEPPSPGTRKVKTIVNVPAKTPA